MDMLTNIIDVVAYCDMTSSDQTYMLDFVIRWLLFVVVYSYCMHSN